MKPDAIQNPLQGILALIFYSQDHSVKKYRRVNTNFRIIEIN